MAVTKELSTTNVDVNTRYAYVLLNKNGKRGGIFDENGRPVGEQEYKTFLNVLTESSILWPGGIDPFTKDENGKGGVERPAGKYFIRYYDGCTTLFKDKQPQDKATIDSLTVATNQKAFSHGYLFVEGYDRMFKIFMDWSSQNEDSPYRIGNSPSFKSVVAERALMSEGQRMDLEDKATELARNASVNKMMSHAVFLEIPMEDNITNVKYSPEVVRIAYRKFAKEKPDVFISSYTDETLDKKVKIKNLIINGTISTSIIPNMLSWASSGTPIINISGIDDIELIVKKATEFSLSDEGKEFSDKIARIK